MATRQLGCYVQVTAFMGGIFGMSAGIGNGFDSINSRENSPHTNVINFTTNIIGGGILGAIVGPFSPLKLLYDKSRKSYEKSYQSDY